MLVLELPQQGLQQYPRRVPTESASSYNGRVGRDRFTYPLVDPEWPCCKMKLENKGHSRFGELARHRVQYESGDRDRDDFTGRSNPLYWLLLGGRRVRPRVVS